MIFTNITDADVSERTLINGQPLFEQYLILGLMNSELGL